MRQLRRDVLQMLDVVIQTLRWRLGGYAPEEYYQNCDHASQLVACGKIVASAGSSAAAVTDVLDWNELREA